jgi:hypothetical protein
MHVNQTSDSGCCNLFQITISRTRYLYVEINNGFKREIIGNEKMIPFPVIKLYSGDSLVYTNIKRDKLDFIKLHHQKVLNNK